MPNFIQRLKERTVAQAETAAEQFRTLVVRIADGDEPSEAQTLKLLEQSGHTLDQLEQAVANLQARREKAAAVAATVEAQVELEQLQAEEQTHIDRFQTVRSEFRQTIDALAVKKAALQRRIEAGHEAKQSLIKTAGCPARLAALEAIVRELHQARVRDDDLTRRAHDKELYAAANQRDIETNRDRWGKEDIAARQRIIDAAQEAAVALREEARANNQRVIELKREEAAAREALADPLAF